MQDYWVNHNLGIAYHARQEFDKAIEHYRAALFSKPSDTNLRKKLASIMIEKENAKNPLGANVAGKKSTTTLEPISHAVANKTRIKKHLPNSADSHKDLPDKNNVNNKAIALGSLGNKEVKQRSFLNPFGTKKKGLLKFRDGKSNSKQRSQLFENRAFVIPADASMIETGNSKKQLTEIVEYQDFSTDTLNAKKDAAVAKYQLGIQHQDQHEIDEAITVYREAVSFMHSECLSIPAYSNNSLRIA